jgi:hypothetical protein
MGCSTDASKAISAPVQDTPLAAAAQAASGGGDGARLMPVAAVDVVLAAMEARVVHKDIVHAVQVPVEIPHLPHARCASESGQPRVLGAQAGMVLQLGRCALCTPQKRYLYKLHESGVAL